MSFQQELQSWWAPKPKTATVAASVPEIGSPAPQTDLLRLPISHDHDERSQHRPRGTVVVFLRHCGCPFAEKTFLDLRETARRHKPLDFVAVSHSDKASTQSWLASLPQAGSEPRNLHIVVDADLDIYAAWGLGPSSFGHVLAPAGLYRVVRMGLDQGIWNRPTASGSRWQTAGAFGIDAAGVVRWGGAARRADEIPDLEAAASAVIAIPP